MFYIAGARPDVLMIFCILFTIKFGRLAGLICGFIVGLLQDVGTIGLLGVYALTKSTTNFWVANILGFRSGSSLINTDRMEFRPPNDTTILIIIFISILLQDLLSAFIHYQGSDVTLINFLTAYALPNAVYTTIIATAWLLLPFRGTVVSKSVIKVKRRE